jgi:hypothetical protein
MAKGAAGKKHVRVPQRLRTDIRTTYVDDYIEATERDEYG